VPESLEELVSTVLGAELQHVLVPDAQTALEVASASGARVGMLLVPEGERATEGIAQEISGSEVGQRALGKLLGACSEAPDLQSALSQHAESGGAFVVRRSDELPPML
jgi:hypothetical protein